MSSDQRLPERRVVAGGGGQVGTRLTQHLRDGEKASVDTELESRGALPRPVVQRRQVIPVRERMGDGRLADSHWFSSIR